MRLNRNTQLTLLRLNLNGVPFAHRGPGVVVISRTHARKITQRFILVLGRKGLSVIFSPAQRGFYKFIPLAFLPNAVRICYEIRPPTGKTTSPRPQWAKGTPLRLSLNSVNWVLRFSLIIKCEEKGKKARRKGGNVLQYGSA